MGSRRDPLTPLPPLLPAPATLPAEPGADPAVPWGAAPPVAGTGMGPWRPVEEAEAEVRAPGAAIGPPFVGAEPRPGTGCGLVMPATGTGPGNGATLP